jgi:hypothetical protein
LPSKSGYAIEQIVNKKKLVKSLKHLKFVAEYPCLICGTDSVQVAHIRSLPSAPIGLGRRDDRYTVPLCWKCHALQHTMNEKEFWKTYNINPLEVSYDLCLKSNCKKVKDFNESTDYFKEGNNESSSSL